MNASLVYLVITSNEATRQIWKALRCRELKSDRRSSQAFYKASLRISSNLNINIQKNYMLMFICSFSNIAIHLHQAWHSVINTFWGLEIEHSRVHGFATKNIHCIWNHFYRPLVNHFCSDRHSVSRPRMLGFRAYSSTSIQENTIKVPSKQWDQGTNENTLFSFEVCRLSSALLVEAKRAVWGNYWKDRKNCKSCPAFLSGLANH